MGHNKTFVRRQWAILMAQSAILGLMDDFSWPNGRFLAHQWAILRQVALRIGVDPVPHEVFHGAGCVLRTIAVPSRYVLTECDAETKISS